MRKNRARDHLRDAWKSGGLRHYGREQHGLRYGALHRYNRDIVSFPVNFNNENLYPKGGESPYKQRKILHIGAV